MGERRGIAKEREITREEIAGRGTGEDERKREERERIARRGQERERSEGAERAGRETGTHMTAL